MPCAPRSSAGIWLFRGRRWLDPADPHDATALTANHARLCAQFPDVAQPAGLAAFLAAVGDVRRRWAALSCGDDAPQIGTPGLEGAGTGGHGPVTRKMYFNSRPAAPVLDPRARASSESEEAAAPRRLDVAQLCAGREGPDWASLGRDWHGRAGLAVDSDESEATNWPPEVGAAGHGAQPCSGPGCSDSDDWETTLDVDCESARDSDIFASSQWNSSAWDWGGRLARAASMAVGRGLNAGQAVDCLLACSELAADWPEPAAHPSPGRSGP